MTIKVSIIYVYYNTPKELLNSINSVKKAALNIQYEIIIVDNASNKKIPKEIQNNKSFKIIRNDKNYGYGKAINIGYSHSSGKYLLVINPDTEFKESAIKDMVNKIEKDNKIVILAPQLINKNGEAIQNINGYPLLPDALFAFSFLNKLFPSNSFSKRYWLSKIDRNKEQNVDYVGGACMMIRKSVFEKIKGFDEKFFMYFEEADICLRVKKIGYKISYFPNAKVLHLIGKSSQDKEWIEKTFQESRFYFFKKHQGIIPAFFGELFLRITKSHNIILILILSFSIFLNLFQINNLMMFFGDFGRDYLAARDMLLTGNIPLLGIPSSVVWLHQGPLSIYLISFALFIGKFNPIAPAVFYGIIGAITTYLLYLLGKTFFNKNIGLLSAAFYATSPLIVVNERMPYHTSPIPFFSSLFFLLLFKSLFVNNKFFPLAFFLLGLLFQLELSNGVIFFLAFILWFIFRPKISSNLKIYSIVSFLIGIAPFLIYDLTHKFTQTLGFLAWVINRTRLFLGLTLSRQSTTGQLPQGLEMIWQEVSRMIFPVLTEIVTVFLLLSLVFIFKKRKELFNKKSNPGFIICILWIIIPIIGFLIHTAPGTAYFPLIYPSVSIFIGFMFYQIIQKIKPALLIFILLIFVNSYFTLSNNYLMTIRESISRPKPGQFNLGYDFILRNEVSTFISQDAKNKAFKVKAGGFLSTFKTGIDNYLYLIWYSSGNIKETANIIYTIYENENEIPNSEKIVYHNKFIYITKSERN